MQDDLHEPIGGPTGHPLAGTDSPGFADAPYAQLPTPAAAPASSHDAALEADADARGDELMLTIDLVGDAATGWTAPLDSFLDPWPSDIWVVGEGSR